MEFHIDQAIEVLSRTPDVLRAMLDGVGKPWVVNNYGPNTFSPFDVAGHLIHGEKTDWISRAKIILEHGETKAFEPFDRYAMYENSKGKTIKELLDSFETLRKKNISVLRELELTPDKLVLRGIHPELGSVTLEQLLATWVVHDLNHIHQIAKCMAFQYGDSTGPWRAYITFLPNEN